MSILKRTPFSASWDFKQATVASLLRCASSYHFHAPSPIAQSCPCNAARRAETCELERKQSSSIHKQTFSRNCEETLTSCNRLIYSKGQRVALHNLCGQLLNLCASLLARMVGKQTIKFFQFQTYLVHTVKTNETFCASK